MGNTDPDICTFISGETVDLIVPTPRLLNSLSWWKHLNDSETTRYMNRYGVFPLLPEPEESVQSAADEAAVTTTSRLLLLIRSRASGEFIGSTTLSQISQESRSAINGLMMLKNKEIGDLLTGLEAKALICQHGFLHLGLRRIYGWQHIDLMAWQEMITILGFFPEGVMKNGFVRGTECADAIQNSCTSERFLKIYTKRNSSLWPGRTEAFKLAKAAMAQRRVKKLVAEAQNREAVWTDELVGT